HTVLGEDLADPGAVALEQLLDPCLPFALPETHAHADAVVELDVRLGRKRYDHELGRLHPAREVAGNGAPDNGGVDLALGQIELDDLAGVLLGVARLPLIGDRLIVQPVLEQPVDARGLGYYADLERPEHLR